MWIWGWWWWWGSTNNYLLNSFASSFSSKKSPENAFLEKGWMEGKFAFKVNGLLLWKRKCHHTEL